MSAWNTASITSALEEATLPWARAQERLRARDWLGARVFCYHLGSGPPRGSATALESTPEGLYFLQAPHTLPYDTLRRGHAGGSPLSEHGVGRSPIKQRTLRRFLGDEAVEAMRRIKLALDPQARFAPGVIFPA